jgi:pimeloyl-ACP methyl ester carboxylesterase
MKKDIDVGEIVVHEWKHWSSGSFSMKRELENILSKIGKDKVNVIAKSVGTRVCMELARQNPEKVEKVILCGIPTKGKSKSVRKLFLEGLSSLDSDKLLVIQNSKDPLADYSTVEKFIHSLDKRVKVVKKESGKHHYPYPEDFEKFLKK